MFIIQHEQSSEVLTLVIPDSFAGFDSIHVQLHFDDSFLSAELRSTVDYDLILIKVSIKYACRFRMKTRKQIFQLSFLSFLNSSGHYISSMGLTHNPDIELPPGNYTGLVLFWKGTFTNGLPLADSFNSDEIPRFFAEHIIAIGNQMFKPGIVLPLRNTYLDAKVNELISVVGSFYSTPSSQLKPDIIEQLRKFETAIEQQLSSLPSFNKLAYAIGLSPAIIRQHFTGYFGCGFRTYVQRIRLKKAKELLVDTRLSIREIAAITGYDYEYSFIRSFSKYFRITPLQFRKKHVIAKQIE